MIAGGDGAHMQSSLSTVKLSIGLLPVDACVGSEERCRVLERGYLSERLYVYNRRALVS